MKILPLVIAASLAANVVLVGALLRSAARQDHAQATAAAPAPPPTAPAAVAAQAWTELQAEDSAAQVERLRAEGFPPWAIRAVMTARVREQFAARRKALEAAEAGQPFWITTVDPKLQAEQRALARDEQRALTALLGPDPEHGMVAQLRRTLPGLSDEKLETLAEIRDRYNEQRSEFGGRGSTPEDRRKLNELEKAMRAELAAVLTPQEFEEYELRTSQTANQLRHTLATFDATEQEYRAIFKLQRAFDEQWSNYQPGATPEEAQARREAQRQLQEQIKAALGPERYADYQRDTDYNYRRLTQLVERLNLPVATARELHTLQVNVQNRASELRRVSSTADERNAQLAALHQQTEADIAAKLGPAGLEAYKQYSGGWLRNLVPAAPTKR